MTGPHGEEHEGWEELAVGHALSALEPADDEAFLQHLPACERCGRTVAGTHEVMAGMAHSVEPVQAPESLRAAISARVALEQRTEFPDEEPDAGWRWPGARVPWYAVAATLALVLALVVWNLVLLSDSRDRKQRLARAEQVVRCVEDPSCHSFPLEAPKGGVAPATALVRDGHIWLVVDGLARNDRKSTIYVLWQKTDDDQIAAVRAFDVTQDGLTVVDAGNLPGSLDDIAWFAVSHEAGRRAPASPSSPLALGNVSV